MARNFHTAQALRPGFSPEKFDKLENRPALREGRFAALLPFKKWRKLPSTIQRRFAVVLRPGESVTYSGIVDTVHMTVLGRIITQLGRLFGAPLPLNCAQGAAATVTIHGGEQQGQYWTRIYADNKGFPQVIQSAKRFKGPTGLEEYVGRGLGMALRLDANDNTLHFLSDHYFFEIGKLRIRLPRLFSPGALIISHVDLGCGENGRAQFAFVLSLNHDLLGELIHQKIIFVEAYHAG